jgi:copper chaperone for superoxide dismutase
MGRYGNESRGKLAPKGVFGTIEVGRNGIGTVFIDKPIQIWEMIGRSMVVSRQRDGNSRRTTRTRLWESLLGVLVSGTMKTVCSCSGKTIWEERKEQVGRGML